MIEAFDLVKTYGKTIAIDHLSLKVEEGEIFGLLGPNGAGKSTLVRILSTLSLPDSGWCKIGGFDTQSQALEVKKLIGVVFQENNLDRDLSGFANLLFQARLHRLADPQNTVMAMLEKLGLSKRAHDPVKNYSGGMKRRLVIGRALLTNPRLLFLDEPTTGLDPGIRREIWQLVKEVKAQGCTVLLTTHYIEEAQSLCDRIGIMRAGSLVALDTPEQLAGEKGLEEAVVSLGGGEA